MTENIQKRGVKAVTWDWEELQSVFSADEELYLLRERDIAVLLTAIAPAMWATRWFNQPSAFGDIEDFVGELNLRLMTPMNLCALVAECILNPDSPANAAVRDIAGTGNGYPANQNPPLSQREKDLLNGTNPTCELDKLYGQCVFLVQSTNRIITDFLEQFEAASNITEILTIIGSSPVLNESGAEALAGYAAYLQEVLAENYAAQYTQELENEIVCGLFCIAKDSCSLQIAQVAEYLAGQAGVSLTVPAVIVDIVAALAGVPLSGAYVVWSMFTLCWKGLELANMFLDGVGDTALDVSLEAGAGEPSDDWMLFCEDCGTPVGLLYDFVAGQQGWTEFDRGEYVSGQGWTINYDFGTSATFFRRLIGSAANVVSVQFEIEMQTGSQPNPLSRFGQLPSEFVTIKNTAFTTGISTYSGDAAVTVGASEYIYADLNTAAGTGGAIGWVRKLYVFFSGAVPTDWGGEVLYE